MFELVDYRIVFWFGGLRAIDLNNSVVWVIVYILWSSSLLLIVWFAFSFWLKVNWLLFVCLSVIFGIYYSCRWAFGVGIRQNFVFWTCGVYDMLVIWVFVMVFLVAILMVVLFTFGFVVCLLLFWFLLCCCWLFVYLVWLCCIG